MRILWAALFPCLLCAQTESEIARFDSLIKAGSYTEAAEQLAAYTSAHPSSWQALYQLGYVEFRLHHIQASVTALSHSLVLYKDSADSHRILAYDLNILGHPDMAIHELTESLRCDDANEDTHYELGRIYYEQGAYTQAVRQLEAAKLLAPQSVRVYHNLGLAYSAIGENQKATSHFEQGLRLNAAASSPSAWPFIDYATFLNAQNQFSKARDLLLQSLRINQSWDRAYSELAKAYRGLSDPEKAISCLQKAIALNERNAEYHYVLSRLYSQTNQPGQAKLELAAYERCKAQ